MYIDNIKMSSDNKFNDLYIDLDIYNKVAVILSLIDYDIEYIQHIHNSPGKQINKEDAKKLDYYINECCKIIITRQKNSNMIRNYNMLKDDIIRENKDKMDDLLKKFYECIVKLIDEKLTNNEALTNWDKFVILMKDIPDLPFRKKFKYRTDNNYDDELERLLRFNRKYNKLNKTIIDIRIEAFKLLNIEFNNLPNDTNIRTIYASLIYLKKSGDKNIAKKLYDYSINHLFYKDLDYEENDRIFKSVIVTFL